MIIDDRIRHALEGVERLAPPDDLRPMVFSALLNDSAPVGTQKQRQGGGRSSRDDQPVPDTLLGQLAISLGLELGLVDRIYEAADDDLRLIVMRSSLPKTKAAAMRDVALLLVVARQAAGIAEETPVSAIRKECDDLGVLDTTNFSTEVNRLGLRVIGSGPGRSLRSNRNHQEIAAQRIRELLGTAA